jgi:PadR family transcriptional regulator, regulatory protein AphA
MSSTRLSSTSFAILGLLSVRAWSTYELAQQVRRSLNWFWPRAERRLYDEPKRLVAEGLATASTEHTGRRARTVYALTERGRAELRRWLGEPPAARATEFEGMVKVFFADVGTLDQLRGNLRAIEDEAQQRLDDLAAMAAHPSRFPEREHLSALCLPLQFEQEAAVLRWARWALEQVESWPATDDPGDWDPVAVRHRLGRTAASGSVVG